MGDLVQWPPTLFEEKSSGKKMKKNFADLLSFLTSQTQKEISGM